MPGYQTGSKDQEDNIVPPPETFQTRRSQWPDNLLAQNSGRLLDRADSVIYFIVGVCFFLAAIMALTYTFWALGVSIIELRALPMNQQPTQGAQAIIELVSVGVSAAVILALGITLKLLSGMFEDGESK
ncbi:MAG: hypothetical protein E6I90_00715 [Chloroflexi bacterium]|nr:MAG: hypothetical protein E6I90_00715 [Chloroflexota bacterium]